MSAAWQREARRLRYSGEAINAIAARFGVKSAHVSKVCSDIPFTAKVGRKPGPVSPHVKTPVLASISAPAAVPVVRKTKAVDGGIEVPLWVTKAGLTADFRDIARTVDEFAAASHCRALLREMRA